jgi:hypothetical protein
MHDAVYTVTPIVHGNYLQHWLIDSQAVLAAFTMQDVELSTGSSTARKRLLQIFMAKAAAYVADAS